MLKMKTQCEKCSAPTGLTAIAFICSFECTFCETCSTQLQCICPNCRGELLRRPTRTRTPVAVGLAQLKKKLLGN
jgi:hypothetical protein